MKLHRFALFAALALLTLQAGIGAAPVDTSGMRLLSYDDGKMDERVKLNLTGATVEFTTGGARDLTGVQFFGSRYATDATPLDNFIVTISDEQFRPMQRIDKPLTNISPGRDTWQMMTLDTPLSVSGKFYVTLIYDSTPRKGVFLGADTTDPGDSSRVGVPGTVAAPVDPKVNFMIRAMTAPPGAAAAARAAKPAPAVKKPAVSAAPSGTASAAKPKPALTPFTRPSAKGQFAYRDANRRLTMRSKAPALPRGAGRVDVSWDVAPPVSVTLQYVGYGAKKPSVSVGQFNASRIVVDFPVPEPAQFSVLVEKPGFQAASKVFRVVRGSNQQWRAMLVKGGGAGAPPPAMDPGTQPADEPVLPANPLPSSVDPGRNATGFGGNMSAPDQPAVAPGAGPVVPSIDAPSPLPGADDPALRMNATPRAPRAGREPGNRPRVGPADGGNAAPGTATDGAYRRPRRNVAPPPAPGGNAGGNNDAGDVPPPPAL